MIWQLAEIFLNVIVPVFALVLIGYVAGPRLNLEARTLSRTAYTIFVPAFVFNVMSTAVFDPILISQMIGFSLAVHLAVALLAFIITRGLRRPKGMIGATMIIAVFGNVGNFGLPMIEFRLGEAALVPATFYFLIILVISFVLAVSIAGWAKGGGRKALLEVVKTPALLALVPALAMNNWAVTPPLMVSRVVALLAAAMVPTMLLALGVQLAGMHQVQINRDVLLASLIRLLGGALLAFMLAAPFGLTGPVRGAGILQASMPTAVLASIIALEYDLLPDFVTTAVLVTTLLSLVTLPLVMLLL